MHGRRLVLGLAVAAAGALLMGCQNGVTGPSLTASILQLDLSPTLKVPAGENICCCHIVGTVKNTSSVGVHIRLQFPAKDKAGASAGAAEVLVTAIPAGTTRDFEAIGIQKPCSSLEKTQIWADQRVRVIGLWEPNQ